MNFLKIGQTIYVDVDFDLKPTAYDTLQEFKKAASKRKLKLNVSRIEQIIAALSADQYCKKIFTFYEFDANRREDQNQTPEIGDPSTKQSQEQQDMISAEMEEAYASSISDPDYTDEQLPLLTVTGALRVDHQCRIRVHGVIDSVGKLFKLFKQLNMRCGNNKCSRYDIPESYLLATPIYSAADLPIAFKDEQELAETLRCPACRRSRN